MTDRKERVRPWLGIFPRDNLIQVGRQANMLI